MKAQLASDAGVKTFEQMIAPTRHRSRATTSSDAVALWVAWLQGKLAMIYSWPPSGRITANTRRATRRSISCRSSTIAGKVGYAVVPGNPEHARGVRQVARRRFGESRRPPISLCSGRPARRCRSRASCCPIALRDPYRLSHFKSPLYRQLWPGAKEYLVNLNNAANWR